jgi:hypothetical protein
VERGAAARSSPRIAPAVRHLDQPGTLEAPQRVSDGRLVERCSQRLAGAARDLFEAPPAVRRAKDGGGGRRETVRATRPSVVDDRLVADLPNDQGPPPNLH